MVFELDSALKRQLASWKSPALRYENVPAIVRVVCDSYINIPGQSLVRLYANHG